MYNYLILTTDNIMKIVVFVVVSHNGRLSLLFLLFTSPQGHRLDRDPTLSRNVTWF